MSRTHFAREHHGPRDIDPRRQAKAQTFIAQQCRDLRQSFLVRHAILAVDRRPFEVGRNPSLPDPFGNRIAFSFQFSVRVVIEQSGTMRVG